MPSHDLTRLLMEKAAQDEFALNKLAQEDDSPTEIIGFHAQQAIEKFLKAVLSFREIDYRRTHDLVELIDLLQENDIPCPEHIEESRRLSPFAAVFRYNQLLPYDEADFEWSWALECVRETKNWAEKIVFGTG